MQGDEYILEEDQQTLEKDLDNDLFSKFNILQYDSASDEEKKKIKVI